MRRHPRRPATQALAIPAPVALPWLEWALVAATLALAVAALSPA